MFNNKEELTKIIWASRIIFTQLLIPIDINWSNIMIDTYGKLRIIDFSTINNVNMMIKSNDISVKDKEILLKVIIARLDNLDSLMKLTGIGISDLKSLNNSEYTYNHAEYLAFSNKIRDMYMKNITADNN